HGYAVSSLMDTAYWSSEHHHIRPETTTTTQTLVSSQNPKVDTCAQNPDVGEDADFKHGSWVSTVEFVNVDWGGSGMLDQVELIKMLEEEVRAEQEWHGDGNLTDEQVKYNSTAFCRIRCCVLLLRFAYAFWFCDLVLRFASAFCLIEDLLAFCLGETLPISIFGCVLSKAWTAFCFKTSCVLSQDFPAFCLRHFTAFCLLLTAFCTLRFVPS
ncbi:hypothetical protein Tco_0556797, partial [Tanacetum coccineum]